LSLSVADTAAGLCCGLVHRGKKTLSPEQAALLKKLAPSLEGHDLEVMNSIINQFAGSY
jgi:hypothetical protein